MISAGGGGESSRSAAFIPDVPTTTSTAAPAASAPTLGSIFPLMNQLKNVLQETIIELSTLKRDRYNQSSLKKLKTYHSPVQLPGSRVKKVHLDTDAANYAGRRLRFD